MKKRLTVTGLLMTIMLSGCFPKLSDPELPNPVLESLTMEKLTIPNTPPLIKYNLTVKNWQAFPDELFEPAPDLPSCDWPPETYPLEMPEDSVTRRNLRDIHPENGNGPASRTWVDIYTAEGTYLFKHCHLSSASDLENIWFVAQRKKLPPAIYITLTDRKDEKTYTSNTICFPYTLPSPKLVYDGPQDITDMNGTLLVDYKVSVENWDEFPDELFELAPYLPHCDYSPLPAARTWLDFYSEAGDHRGGYCVLRDSSSLKSISFITKPIGEAPPPPVYIELNDRLCGKIVTSNVVSFE